MCTGAGEQNGSCEAKKQSSSSQAETNLLEEQHHSLTSYSSADHLGISSGASSGGLKKSSSSGSIPSSNSQCQQSRSVRKTVDHFDAVKERRRQIEEKRKKELEKQISEKDKRRQKALEMKRNSTPSKQSSTRLRPRKVLETSSIFINSPSPELTDDPRSRVKSKPAPLLFSSAESLLNTVNSLLTTPQEKLSADQSIFESIEENKDDHPVDSEMVVKELAHNSDLLKIEANSKTHVANTQPLLVIEDKTEHINIPEEEFDDKPENVTAHSLPRLTGNSKCNDTSEDLMDTTVPQQESSRDNSRSANAVTENIAQCSEVDSPVMDSLGTVQSSDAVNQPNDSSYGVEVSTIHYDSYGSCYCNKSTHAKF